MSTTPGAEPLERTMESFVNAEHFEDLYAPGARGGVACITPTSPWTLPNGTFMRQYRRQPPRETSHVFRWKHVALGMMAKDCGIAADLVGPGFDHGMMHLQRLPFLEEEAPHEFADVLTARDVMAREIIVLKQCEKAPRAAAAAPPCP